MPNLLSIDPGNIYSGFALVDMDTYEAVLKGKIRNDDLIERITNPDSPHVIEFESAAIEMIASYGMAVGSTTFETCVWIGRFMQSMIENCDITPELVFRKEVKLHHCHSPRASDTTVRQALVDRFSQGYPNQGKGYKHEPGPLYGFSNDIWSAYAIAVYYIDIKRGSNANVQSGAFR